MFGGSFGESLGHRLGFGWSIGGWRDESAKRVDCESGFGLDHYIFPYIADRGMVDSIVLGFLKGGVVMDVIASLLGR